MKTASLILGILGGLAGILGAIFAVFIGGANVALNDSGSSTIAMGFMAIFLSIMGIVGGAMARSKPSTAGKLMLIAGILGAIAISVGYVVAAPLLIIAGIMALIEGRKEPRENKKKYGWIGWAAFALVLFLIIMSSYGSDSKQSTSTSNDTGTTAVTSSGEQKNDASQEVGINQDIRVGDIRWKVLNAQDKGSVLRSSNQYTNNKETTGKFIQVEFEFENLQSDNVSADEPTLIDSKGREFERITGVYSFIPDEKQFFMETVNPNITKQFIVIYEVPTDATGLKLKVGDFKVFSSKAGYVNLGL